jgi:hypothetical protein
MHMGKGELFEYFSKYLGMLYQFLGFIILQIKNCMSPSVLCYAMFYTLTWGLMSSFIYQTK